MPTKFEQLLDLLVNEEMDKANDLFHEIVVEKSRDIYENLIAEEEEEQEESAEMDDESVEEAADDEQEESVEEGQEDLEDSYMMDGDETGDSGDDFGGEVSASGDNFDAPADDDMGGEEGGEEGAIFDIKNAIAELEAAFAELEQAKGMGGDDEFGSDDMGGDDMGDEEGEDEMMGFQEGRRMTREYVEKVGNDWEKNSQKTQGQYAGAGTGDKDGAPQEGKSPISSGKGKPVTGATAANIAKGGTEPGTNTGTSPQGKAGGFLKNATDMGTGNGNVPGGKMGVKNLSKVPGGHGAEKKGAGPGPVGSGSGDKAGQTSIDPATKRQFLPSQAK